MIERRSESMQWLSVLGAAVNASVPACNLVLARYHEPIEWALPLLRAGIDVTILNRGGWHALDAHISAGERVRSSYDWHAGGLVPGEGRLHVRNRLANVGREGFAFLEYMTERATSWKDDITAFCQADPDCRWYTRADLIDDLQRLCARRVPSGKPLNRQHSSVARAFLAKGFAFLSRCHPLFQPDKFIGDSKMHSFRAAFSRAFNGTVAEYEALRWCPTSCFVLSQETFTRTFARKSGTFEELARMLGSSNRPVQAELLERAWGHLFDQKAVGLLEATSEQHSGSSASMTRR